MKRSSQEDKETMSCDVCLGKFTFLKRKKQCIECRREYCASCTVKEHGRLMCKHCKVLLAVPPNPSELMRLKAKVLKQFLCQKHVSHQGCTQKDELVNLVLQMAVNVNRVPPRANFASSSATSSAFSEPSSFPRAPPQRNERSDTQPPSSSHQQAHTFSQGNNSSNTAQTSDSQSTTSSEPSAESGSKGEDTLSSLENLASEDAINSLSVRQLKLLLLRHFVDYKGCCEKTELQDRVRRLWRHHNESQQTDPDDIPNEQLCKICWEAPINCVLLECGHMATCTDCGKRMHECPICRQYVVRVVHTFRA